MRWEVNEEAAVAIQVKKIVTELRGGADKWKQVDGFQGYLRSSRGTAW